MNVKGYYFPNILRKVNLAMLGLFSGIQVAKQDPQRNNILFRRVPIRFANRQKFIPLLTANQEGNLTFFYQNLPIMGLMINNMSYTPNKVRGGFNAPIYKWFDDLNRANKTMYSGTPYTINYKLGILSLHMKEMSMILEQILPWFNPYRNITIQEWDFLPELTRDLKVTLKNTTPSFADEIAESQIKHVEFSMELDVECMMYLPIPINELIKYVHVDYNMLDPQTLASTIYSVSGNSIDNYIVTEDYSYEFEIAPSAVSAIDGGFGNEYLRPENPANLWGGSPGTTFTSAAGLPYGKITDVDGGSVTG